MEFIIEKISEETTNGNYCIKLVNKSSKDLGFTKIESKITYYLFGSVKPKLNAKVQLDLSLFDIDERERTFNDENGEEITRTLKHLKLKRD